MGEDRAGQNLPQILALILPPCLTFQQALRYKDFHLVARPSEVRHEHDIRPNDDFLKLGVFETDSVKRFGHQMEQRGVFAWWRRSMGYSDEQQI